MKTITQTILCALIFVICGLNNRANAQQFLKDLDTVGYASSNPSQFINVNGSMYIQTNRKIWKSDGTAAGTVLLMDGIDNSVKMFNMNNTLYFVVVPPGGPSSIGIAWIWKSDGTTAGTILLDSLATQSPFSQTGDAQARNFMVVGDKLFFQMGKGSGLELWVTDGSVGGAKQVVDLAPGGQGAYKYGGLIDAPMIAYNGKIYFKGTSTGQGDNELYVSDGTPAGTMLVKDITPGSASSDPSNWVIYNNELYFLANGGLCKTDGTTAGTVLVSAGDFETPAVFKGAIYFGRGNDLWKTNGTTAGTVFVTDSTNKISGANADYLIAFYVTSKPVAPYLDYHYRRTDGTTTIPISTKVGYGASFVLLNNKMYHFGPGDGLYSSDGTEAGSGQLATNVSNYFHVFNGSLYYNAWTRIALTGGNGYGYELWWLEGIATTGLSTINKEQKSLVYPNPSTGKITCISSKIFSEIKVYDMLGSLIYCGNIVSEKTEIDLTQHPKGVYFFHLTGDNQTEEVGKIIIE